MFCHGKDVNDFALCLSDLVQQLVRHDNNINEQKTVEKYMCVVPKYAQIALAMETLLDFDRQAQSDG